MTQKLRCKLIAALAALMWALTPATAAYAEFTVPEIEAAQVFQFFGFVEWPGDKDYKTQSNIRICTLGSSPVNSILGTITKTASAKMGKQFSLTEVKSARNGTEQCHVLFVGESERGRIDEVVGPLSGLPVLTVSDAPGFAESGGMIGFVIVSGKVKFAINTKTAYAAGFRISPDMLELADKVIK